MLRKTVSGIILTLLFIGTLTLAFNIQPVKSTWTGTVYIRADGSIDPPDAPIITYDNVTYTLTDNIASSADGIVVERDNIIIDGKGYVMKGTKHYDNKGIMILANRNNVTIINTQIMNFWCGVYFYCSSNSNISGNNIVNNFQGVSLFGFSNSTISRNNIANNDHGIYLHSSFNNTISENNITANSYHGIFLVCSSNNIMSRNNIANNEWGMRFTASSNNTITENNIRANSWNGIWLRESSSDIFYHNNFIDNNQQVYIETSGYVNFWDNGYPSGGNYWSDYTGVDADGDGIGDAPYIIDEDNQDRYPLMNRWKKATFMAGDVVRTTDDLNVREGPGLSYAVIDTMIKGNEGVVLSGPIEADGYNWWYINYSVGVVGWSAENWLELAPTPPSSPQNFVYWAEAAIEWAMDRLGRNDWSGRCMRFVANAFMQKEHEPAGYNAIDGAREFYRFDQEPNGWLKAPKGALIFFDKEGTNVYGHVGIYLGNASIIHAYGTVRVDTVEEVIAKPDVGRYLGWSYPPESWRPSQFTFKAVWGSTEYPVTVSSNSIVTDFEFNQPLMQISFMISGEQGMQGYCNITIPKTLLRGEPWTVKLNGTKWNFQSSENETHSFIYFTYTHASRYEVVLQGSWVIPEFPSITILPILMLATLITTIVFKKRRKPKTQLA